MVRRFMVMLTTDVDFVGDDPTDGVAENYEKHLLEEVRNAAQKLSLRTMAGHKIMKAQAVEIKGAISL